MPEAVKLTVPWKPSTSVSGVKAEPAQRGDASPGQVASSTQVGGQLTMRAASTTFLSPESSGDKVRRGN